MKVSQNWCEINDLKRLIVKFITVYSWAETFRGCYKLVHVPKWDVLVFSHSRKEISLLQILPSSFSFGGFFLTFLILTSAIMKLQSWNILMVYLVRICDCRKQTNNFRTEMLKSAHSSQRLLSIFLYCVAQGLGKNCPLLMLICTLYCQVLFYCHSICTTITLGHVQLSDCHLCLK